MLKINNILCGGKSTAKCCSKGVTPLTLQREALRVSGMEVSFLSDSEAGRDSDSESPQLSLQKK